MSQFVSFDNFRHLVKADLTVAVPFSMKFSPFTQNSVRYMPLKLCLCPLVILRHCRIA